MSPIKPQSEGIIGLIFIASNKANIRLYIYLKIHVTSS